MKSGAYVRVLEVVKGLEATSYRDFDILWKKLSETRGTARTLTDEESKMMDDIIMAMQDLGYIRGVLEGLGGEE